MTSASNQRSTHFRRHIRPQQAVNVTLRRLGDITRDMTTTKDLGLGGARIPTTRKTRLGSKLIVDIHISGSKLSIPSEVRWVDDANAEIGVAFSEVSQEIQAKLASLVDRLSAV